MHKIAFEVCLNAVYVMITIWVAQGKLFDRNKTGIDQDLNKFSHFLEVSFFLIIAAKKILLLPRMK
jgi:hypothetical protein